MGRKSFGNWVRGNLAVIILGLFRVVWETTTKKENWKPCLFEKYEKSFWGDNVWAEKLG